MKHLFLLACICFSMQVFGQNQQYQVSLVGFYNLENLFDTLDTPDKHDSEFTPTGSKAYNTSIYLDKLGKLDKVISQIGTDLSPDGLAVVGVCEVENKKVLLDLVQEKGIASRNYQVVHHESNDFRGIDNALLYNPKYFQLDQSQVYEVELPMVNGEKRTTRDILHVSGSLAGERIHFLVNHWPSRSGGEKGSAPKRAAAAKKCRQIVDNIYKAEPNAQIVIMGDLNDDPADPSVIEHLGVQVKESKVRNNDLFNPYYKIHKGGNGTLCYRGNWNLFDQIIVSQDLMEEEGFYYKQAHIFKKQWMFTKEGRYKGYPLRTFGGSTYLGGYSDHFPSYIVLLKKI